MSLPDLSSANRSRWRNGLTRPTFEILGQRFFPYPNDSRSSYQFGLDNKVLPRSLEQAIKYNYVPIGLEIDILNFTQPVNVFCFVSDFQIDNESFLVPIIDNANVTATFSILTPPEMDPGLVSFFTSTSIALDLSIDIFPVPFNAKSLRGVTLPFGSTLSQVFPNLLSNDFATQYVYLISLILTPPSSAPFIGFGGGQLAIFMELTETSGPSRGLITRTIVPLQYTVS